MPKLSNITIMPVLVQNVRKVKLKYVETRVSLSEMSQERTINWFMLHSITIYQFQLHLLIHLINLSIIILEVLAVSLVLVESVRL